MTTTTPARVTAEPFVWHRMWVVARTDLQQLLRSKDYLLPMMALGFLFFVAVPLVLLLTLTNVDNANVAVRISESLSILPEAAQTQIQGSSPGGRTAYALAVYLFAPVAVVVPLTISTAVGAATIVGERERGTGEFLAHSPASTREIYMGKLIASLVPGYVTTIVGFGTYALIVNLVVGPEVGGWFFPTHEWWVMMLWIIPPFLLLTLSLVLRLSARVKSTAAAQQASGLITLPLIGIAYSQATGSLLGAGGSAGIMLGGVAWIVAIISLLPGRAVGDTQPPPGRRPVAGASGKPFGPTSPLAQVAASTAATRSSTGR